MTNDTQRRLLLVHPPQRNVLNGFAAGLVDLANFVLLYEPNAELDILDLALCSTEEGLERLREVLPLDDKGATIVGITATTASYQSALQTARSVKAIDPSALVVFGGHHASPEREVVMKAHRGTVDAVVQGEGERPLLEIVRGRALRDIPGVTSWGHTKLLQNPPAPLLNMVELDALPVNFRGRSFESDPGKFGHATYVSARGCPLHCAFCAVAGQTIRAKSVGQVVRDVRHLIQSVGARRIAIEDNFFAQSESRTLSLCEHLEALRESTGVDFNWDCQTRVESLKNKEVVVLLKRAGCDGIYLGVESVVDEELVYLGKAARPSHYLRALDAVVASIVEQGMGCYVNLQVGLPGETPESRGLRHERIARIGRIAARHGGTITIFPMLHVIYPGTRHFWDAVNAKRFGENGREIFEAFTKWEEREEPILRFLGENFAHGVGGIPLGILDSAELRNGRFEVVEDETEIIRSSLEALNGLVGIEVFKYGSHLIPCS